MNSNVLSILLLLTTLLAAALVQSTSTNNDDVVVKHGSAGNRAVSTADTFDDHSGRHHNTKLEALKDINIFSKTKRSASESGQHAKHSTYKGKIAAGIDWITRLANLLSAATAYGTTVWMTFISTHVLGSSTLPRQQFGMVQSKLYPVYFKTVALSTAIALFCHLLRFPAAIALFPQPFDLQGLSLVTALTVVGVNGLCLEPLARKAMLERMKVEKEEGRGGGAWQMGEAAEVVGGDERLLTEGEKETRLRVGRLDGRVKRLNSYSTWLNLVSFLGLTCHLVCLGHRLTN